MAYNKRRGQGGRDGGWAGQGAGLEGAAGPHLMYSDRHRGVNKLHPVVGLRGESANVPATCGREPDRLSY